MPKSPPQPQPSLTAAAAPDVEGLPPLPPLPETYEAAAKELDALVSTMESGQMPLEQLFSSYRRGSQLMGYCKAKLESVENQIKLLESGELKAWPAAAAK
jgi:exodeoxyribonuclease VII small subunit